MVSVLFVGCGNSTKSTDSTNNTNNTDESVVSFATKDLNGTEVDSSLFAKSDLTMINIWATFCQPCIVEIPEIQVLYDRLKNEGLKVNIIGIVSDTPNKENEDKAIKILESSGAKYLNIIPGQKLLSGVLKKISAVPTTIFVDNKGKIVGEFVIGMRSKEDYKKEITNRLNSLNK